MSILKRREIQNLPQVRVQEARLDYSPHDAECNEAFAIASGSYTQRKLCLQDDDSAILGQPVGSGAHAFGSRT